MNTSSYSKHAYSVKAKQEKKGRTPKQIRKRNYHLISAYPENELAFLCYISSMIPLYILAKEPGGLCREVTVSRKDLGGPLRQLGTTERVLGGGDRNENKLIRKLVIVD